MKTKLEEFCDIGLKIFKGEKATRLEPVNHSNSIEEGLKTCVKDPLWLLGRQWQTGEFEAQNGGIPVRTELKYSNKSVNRIKNDYKSEYNTFELDILYVII